MHTRPLMKLYTALACLLNVFLLAAVPARAAEAEEPVTYVIPIHGMIERALVYVVRRGVAEAVREGAGAIVFDMNTPGGRLDAAEEIIATISKLEIPTYTFVNPSAISAGAIIALATDDIYMAPGSRIGDAMPMMMTMFGGAQEMSEAQQEKAVSYVSALIRSTAETKGHDPQLAEAMVRREIEYKIEDEIICEAKELLTLTNLEAERLVQREEGLRPLLSRGTVPDLDTLLDTVGRASDAVKTFEISFSEKVARYVEWFSVIFLACGILGIYIEFKTPGFGLPGLLGILFLAIWFWGHHVAGLAGMGEVVLFAIGATLLAIEIFVIPGFGFVGATGLVLVIVSLMMAMVQHYPGGPWYRPPIPHMEHAIWMMGTSLMVTFVLALILARYLPRTHAFSKLVLTSAEGRELGYQASHPTDEFVGRHGKAVTPLRPAGIGIFDHDRLNVVARGSFIERDAPIVIAETHGNRIVVEPIKETGSS